ncbi:hypothetical protein [Nannocystis exedens]|uniref:hypothetical protein n=1 Tax=Nannocystis exedens TaxID=54 RepID=UPI0011607D4A|nr:hypothetical protein [Nannocystis exedens]
MASVLACGSEGPCGSAIGLCAGEGRWRIVATPVDDAVLLDVDGDGVEESAVLSREARKLTLGYGSGAHDPRRSALYLEGEPVGLAALPREVAVALAEPSRVAIFGSTPTVASSGGGTSPSAPSRRRSAGPTSTATARRS